MSSGIKKVFLVIGTLVLCIIVWGFFFNGGGVLTTAANGVGTAINNTWTNISGSNNKLVPTLGNNNETKVNTDTSTVNVGP